MNYEAIKYKNQEEAVSAFKRMIQRKREWIEQTEEDFRRLRQAQILQQR